MALPPNLPPKPWTDGQEWKDPDNCATYIYSAADGKWYTSCCGGEPAGDPENGDYVGPFQNIRAWYADDGTKSMGVGSNGSVVITTDAARSFAEVTSNISVNLHCVSYGHGMWVAGGDNGYIGTSTDDGKTWTTRKSGGRKVFEIEFGDGVFIAVSDDWETIFRSTDGTTWTAVHMGWGGDGGKGTTCITYNPDSKIWITGRCTDVSSHRMNVSTDNGLIWNAISFTGHSCPAHFYVGHDYIATLCPDFARMYISDGTLSRVFTHVTNHTMTSAYVGAFYSHINDAAVAYDRSGNVIMSTDWANGLRDWYPAPNNFNFKGVAWDQGQFELHKYSNNSTHEVLGFNERVMNGIGYRPSYD